jgi:hypothetical protein
MDSNGSLWIAIAAIGSLLTGIAAMIALSKDDPEGPSRSEPEIAENRADLHPQGPVVETDFGEQPRARTPPPELDTRPSGEAVIGDPLESAAGNLPLKVDIFWCEDGSDAAAARRKVALAVRRYLDDSGLIRTARARPLGADVNRSPSYSIYDNIVRYDPGEAEAAKALARASEKAAETSFSAAPALPGSPSIDYLSIFVCR